MEERLAEEKGQLAVLLAEETRLKKRLGVAAKPEMNEELLHLRRCQQLVEQVFAVRQEELRKEANLLVLTEEDALQRLRIDLHNAAHPPKPVIAKPKAASSPSKEMKRAKSAEQFPDRDLRMYNEGLRARLPKKREQSGSKRRSKGE